MIENKFVNYCGNGDVVEYKFFRVMKIWNDFIVYF